MAVFGAGTLPLMLATVLVGRVVRPRQWQGLRQAAPFGLAKVGVDTLWVEYPGNPAPKTSTSTSGGGTMAWVS